MITPQQLTIDDRTKIQSYLHKDAQQISELTFTNLFVWRHSRPIWTAEVNDSLVFLIEDDNTTNPGLIILGGPIGQAEPEVVFRNLDMPITGATRVPETARSALINTGYPLLSDRDNADYVYLVSDLAELAGRQFTKKRNHINQCLKNYSCVYEPIYKETINECLALQDRWCRLRGCHEKAGLCHEYQAICELFANYEILGVTGGAIRVNDRIEAFAVAERLSPDTAVWHFEKAMPEIEGLGQLINHWFAKNSLSAFTFVNREQDLGIDGLRQAKESYHPFYMVPKYTSKICAAQPDPGRAAPCFHP
ncbi:MAG: hypothetical protein A2511_06600 [Deltaproteobacteria bacterium RIFOXYD12_FULL_50_9]|nr:MAG: hypothetical protein A2511_06600 [Deltaproteobacteria bacterium RIFOXYD12_FULL_50_9]